MDAFLGGLLSSQCIGTEWDGELQLENLFILWGRYGGSTKGTIVKGLCFHYMHVFLYLLA